MTGFCRIICLGVLLLAAGTRAHGQGAAADKVDLKVVKYAGLADIVLQNRGKVVLVDFWNTGCIPCLRNFPHVIEMQQKYRKDGLIVVTVSLDLASTKKVSVESVQKRLDSLGVNVLNLVLDEPPEIWEKLRIKAVPCVYLFDRQGRWRQLTNDGDEPQVTPANLDALVEKLLQAK